LLILWQKEIMSVISAVIPVYMRVVEVAGHKNKHIAIAAIVIVVCLL